MGLYTFYRISKPSADKVEPDKVDQTYISLRRRTFWGATIAYSLYYVCRMSLSVVKQPLIDEGVLTAGELGLIGSALLLVYAVGKFMNGFIADYCNVRRFMATGLLISTLVNRLMGVFGLLQGPAGLPSVLIFVSFAVLCITSIRVFSFSSRAPLYLVPDIRLPSSRENIILFFSNSGT